MISCHGNTIAVGFPFDEKIGVTLLRNFLTKIIDVGAHSITFDQAQAVKRANSNALRDPRLV